MLCTRRPGSSVTDAGVTGGAEPGSRVAVGRHVGRRLERERERRLARRRPDAAGSRSGARAPAARSARARCAGTTPARAARCRRSARRTATAHASSSAIVKSSESRVPSAASRGRSASVSAGDHRRAEVRVCRRRGTRSPRGPAGSATSSGVRSVTPAQHPHEHVDVAALTCRLPRSARARRAPGSSGRRRAARSRAGPSASTPVSSALVASSRWRWNVTGVTDSTPSTACAAATIADR